MAKGLGLRSERKDRVIQQKTRQELLEERHLRRHASKAINQTMANWHLAIANTGQRLKDNKKSGKGCTVAELSDMSKVIINALKAAAKLLESEDTEIFDLGCKLFVYIRNNGMQPFQMELKRRMSIAHPYHEKQTPEMLQVYTKILGELTSAMMPFGKLREVRDAIERESSQAESALGGLRIAQ